MNSDLYKTFIQTYEDMCITQGHRMHDLNLLIKQGYIKPQKGHEKAWTARCNQGHSRSDDPYIPFELTDKGRDLIQKNRDVDYDKGNRQLVVKLKEADAEVRPKELYIGDVVTGHFRKCESSRTGNFDGDKDFEYEDANYENSEEVLYERSEDYITKITRGEVVTAQVCWISESGREDRYGLVGFVDGKLLYTAITLDEILSYVKTVYWDWRVVQEGESITLKVQKLKKEEE